MRKLTKVKKRNLFLIVGIILVALIFVLLVQQGKIKLKPFASTGFTIASISKNVDIITEDTDLKGVWWLINTYAGGGQNIVGTITPEETKQRMGYQIEYPLTISASAVDERAEYKLSATGQSIDYYQYSTTTSPDGYDGNGKCKKFIVFPYKDAPICPSGTHYTIPLKFSRDLLIASPGYTCWRLCVSKKQAGVLSNIDPSRVKDTFTVTLSAKGKSIPKIISQDSPSADFFDGNDLLGQVQFPSSGWTGNFPPGTSGYKGYFRLTEKKWKITSNSRVTEYNNIFTSVDTNLRAWSNPNIKTEVKDASEFYNDAIAEVQRLVDIVVKMGGDDMSIGQNPVWGNRNDKQKGLLSISTGYLMAVPNLIIKVRADWLGIKIDVGIPAIVGKTCNEFRSGDSGGIDIQVSNIGTAEGTFGASIVECGVINQTYTSSFKTIPPGETKIISLIIDAGTFAGEKTETCQIEVYDFNKPSNNVRDTVDCGILPPALCVEEDFYIENKCIKKCIKGEKKELKCCEGEIIYDPTKADNELGGYDCRSLVCTTDANCPDGYKCVNGECIIKLPKCASCDEFALSTLVGSIWKEKQCEPTLIALPPQTFTTCGFSFVRWLLIPVVLIFSSLFGIDFLERFKTLRGDKNKLARFLLSIIIGGILAYLTYIMFWIGVIAVAGYFIYFMTIGGKIRRLIG